MNTPKTQISLRLPEATITDLDKAAEDMRLPRTTIIQIAIVEYLKRQQEKAAKGNEPD